MTAEELKEIRKSRMKMTQLELADLLQVSIHAVQAWEQDKNPVPKSIAQLIDTYRELKFPLATLIRISAVARDLGITFEEAFFDSIKIAINGDQAPKSGKRGK
ncbi:MAG: helix-turn-helix domain-containing protein [Luteolibacter sp.]